MKTCCALLVAILGGIFPESATALTLPTSEDTFSSNSSVLLPASGKAPGLQISARQKAFIRFEMGSFAGEIPGPEVTRAYLMVYIKKVSRAGSVEVHAVAGEWSEMSAAAIAEPSIQAGPISTIPADSLIGEQFVMVDVTDQVRTWLSAPASDFGFALSGDATAKLEIGSKEGPSSGYPAVLQIERSPMVGNSQLAGGIDATKIGGGSVDNVELGFLNGTTSVLQPQIDQLGTGLTDMSATVDGKVSRSGDTMSGLLVLPADGLKVGESQLAVAGGKVGIGTSAPSAALEVRGDVKLGAAGDLHAAGGEESLRIVRGTIVQRSGLLSLISGSGFTFARTGLGAEHLTVTFTKPFSSPPTVTFSQELDLEATNYTVSTRLRNVTASEATVLYGANYSGVAIHFIAIGPR